jgi:hypothetical protein
MTRAIDAAADAALNRAEVHAALLITLDFASGPMRMFTGLGRLVWAGNTYTGAGDLVGISTIEETSELRSTVTTLTLSGVPTSLVGMAQAANEAWQNRSATLHLATFDETGRAFDGEPTQLLAGRMDQLTYTEGDTASFALSIESRLVDLERARVRRYTDEDQQAEYPDDKVFEYVEDIAAGLEIEL